MYLGGCKEREKIELSKKILSNRGNGICWWNEVGMRNINEQIITSLVLNESFSRYGNITLFSTLLKTGEDTSVERNQVFSF